MERKIWVTTQGSPIYPNMYVVLVATPGVGKSEITWRVRKLWQELEGHFVASTSVTKASMMDELAQAARRVVDTKNSVNPVMSFNSLKLCINELGVLIPGYDNEFMNTLTDLWDCKDYSESRRNKNVEDIKVEKAQLHMLAACTPSYLVNLLPEGAWDQGFISRTFLIFSGERKIRSLFDEQEIDQAREDLLERDLAHIANLTGQLGWSDKAAELMEAFNMRDGEPKPEHPKLMSYNVRRVVHLIKLCMIACVSESDEMVIRSRHFQRAYDWLTEAEAMMPEIFKSMSTSSTGKIMEEAWYYLYTAYSKEGSAIPIARLIQFLQERVPIHNIQTTIDMMEKGGMIEKQLKGGGPAYRPKGKKRT